MPRNYVGEERRAVNKTMLPLKQGVPVPIRVLLCGLDGIVRLCVGTPQLSKFKIDEFRQSCDQVGAEIKYKIKIYTKNGSWSQTTEHSIKGKMMAKEYYKFHTFKLPANISTTIPLFVSVEVTETDNGEDLYLIDNAMSF